MPKLHLPTWELFHLYVIFYSNTFSTWDLHLHRHNGTYVCHSIVTHAVHGNYVQILKLHLNGNGRTNDYHPVETPTWAYMQYVILRLHPHGNGKTFICHLTVKPWWNLYNIWSLSYTYMVYVMSPRKKKKHPYGCYTCYITGTAVHGIYVLPSKLSCMWPTDRCIRSQSNTYTLYVIPKSHLHEICVCIILYIYIGTRYSSSSCMLS